STVARASARDRTPGKPGLKSGLRLQAPSRLKPLPHAALDAIGYPWWDESDNPAYRLFAR
ncbi:hypothetical protein R0G64_31470, partial [Pseudomonas otitidis]|nr:hypothetical protein [Pseudomonas otitidis]